MRSVSRNLSSIVLAAVFSSSLLIAGCAARVTYHDGYYNDDHVWNRNERGFYARWEGETHRNHVDFARRPEPEQKEYYTWRHDHH